MAWLLVWRSAFEDDVPVLFENATDREALVESLLDRPAEGERRNWDVSFLRNFNDWELEVVAAFLNLIDSHIPIRREEMEVYRDWDFNVQSFYKKKV